MELKETRQKKGLTQQELSVQSGINLSTIQKLERGENNLSGARFSTILALYRVLGGDVFIAAGMTEEEINNVANSNSFFKKNKKKLRNAIDI